ncbi:Glutaredoxin-like protein C5orf63-like protein [Colletotrichum sp. SAR 10_70]|nr:Glutaredoxin-like protein C5orf63-like protein [Colletotrichum sp. SAR 10_70]
MFTPTRRLFQQALACRITLFTRDGCGLCIHISKAEAPEEDPDPRVVGKAVKLMHRFDPDQIEAKMDQVEGK